MKKSLPLAKYAAWSPSKATLAGTCPQAFIYRYVDKVSGLATGTPAKVGVTVHRAQELVLQGKPVKQALESAILESEHQLTYGDQEQVRTFAHNIMEFDKRIARFKESNPVKETYLETKWAIDANFNPVQFADPTGIVRGVVDMALDLVNGYVIIIDHKSGRVRPADYYKTQLDFYTVMALAFFPDLKGVQCALHYVAHGKLEWGSPVKPRFIREVLQPWMLTYLNKKTERIDSGKATPGKHCNWCDFREICTVRGTNVEAGEGNEDC